MFIESIQVRPRGKMPHVCEGNGFLPHLQGELLRFSGDASPRTMVHDTNGYRVLAGFQETRGNRIFPHRVMVTGILVATDALAIDPGNVHVIDLTEVQDGLRLGLLAGQFDGFAKPNHAIVAGQPGVFKMTGNLHGFPLGVIKCWHGPSFALGARINCHDQSRPARQRSRNRLGGRGFRGYRLFWQGSVQLFFGLLLESNLRVVHQFDRTITYGLGGASMDLEGNLSRKLALGVFQSHAQFAVDGSPYLVPDGKDFVAVPVAGLDRASSVVVPVQFAAAVLVVELTPYPAPDVGLVSNGLAGGIGFLGTKLDACVAVVRGQLHVNHQVKVLHFAIGPDKFVLRHVHRRMPHDSTVLDRPVLHLGSRPAGEVFAIEE